MSPTLRDAVPALGISLAGLGLLLGLALAPRADAAALGLIVPPWMSPADGLRAAAASAVPIVDLRAGGRLIVVQPPAADRSAWPPPGLIPISAAGSLCRTPPTPAAE